MTSSARKLSGAYYTPGPVVAALVRWAVRQETDRLLDPSCGDGRFIAAHCNSYGVEQDAEAATLAMNRAPRSSVHEGDFFAWAAQTRERFECAAGNPPFIRYQTFKGETRRRALDLCAGCGVLFSGLAASWAPFLVATANCLKPGGRMAFVVPAAIGHAPYAAPLLEYLVGHFDEVRIVAVREKLFPGLSEDCWLLYANGFGGETTEIRFSAIDRFESSEMPPREAVIVPVEEWRTAWNRRLRPYLLPERMRSHYRAAIEHEDAVRFGDIASIGIGYVSGANGFFHLRPSEVEKFEIPGKFLWPTVRSNKVLPDWELTRSTLDHWRLCDHPMMLLNIPKHTELPSSVSKYLDTDKGKQARKAYKCRTRNPWYSVPDVRAPDFFLTYMSGCAPGLVRNSAAATCTNAVHGVHLHDRSSGSRVTGSWTKPFVRLSCELEGHPLGGGVLKLEPGEAAKIAFPPPCAEADLPESDVMDSISTMRRWRHHAA